LITTPLGGLSNHHPRHLQVAGQQIQIMEISQQPEPAAARAGQAVGVQPFRLAGRM
jgi:hypothetical protein